LNKVLDRKRGKGVAFLDWDDDSATPNGAIDVKLRVYPQLYNNITYQYPAGTTVTIKGAATKAEYFTSVDLENDQRVADDLFSLRDQSDSTVDELTTEGERIEVAVTASGYDVSLAHRWDAALETAWSTAALGKESPLYDRVLQYFGLLRTSGHIYRNGDNESATEQRADFWTDATGKITKDHTVVTAPVLVEVMSDLPFYEGYDYEPDIPVPAASSVADGNPRRRKPMVLVRTTTNRFLDIPRYGYEGGAEVSVDPDGVWVKWAGDEEGTRLIRSQYNGLTAHNITESSLTLTIGLRMPQRHRFTSAITGTVRRRRTIRIADNHLWISHPGCIWDLDPATGDADGDAAKRVGGALVEDANVKGKLLRDDRAALARIHNLTWNWYRSDSPTMSATWGIRDCGMLPSWVDIAGTGQAYPKLGQIVNTMAAGGASYTLNTPVSRITYDNVSGTTTWATDWTEFDYGAA
jgi:hypothetical protein